MAGMLRFVEGKPAVLAGNALVLADIHVGIEQELFEMGIRARSPMKEMLDEIIGMCDEHSPKLAVLLGDVKHSITQAPSEEERDLREFVREISKRVPVVIVPGNHDGRIGKIIGSGAVGSGNGNFSGSGHSQAGASGFLGQERIRVVHASGFVHDGFGFFHGHSWPSAEVMGQETVLMAHQHPLVELADKVGGRHLLRAWCIGELGKHERFLGGKAKKAVIMPAFNPLAGGAVFNRKPPEGLHGPVMKNMFKLAKSEIYLLDGTPLGKAESLTRGGTGSVGGIQWEAGEATKS